MKDFEKENLRLRRATHRGHHRACEAVWAVRLSPGDGAAASRGLEGEPQTRLAYLAQGGPEGTAEAAKARATMVERRLLHSATTGVSGACMGL